jgi:hypothetical protein
VRCSADCSSVLPATMIAVHLSPSFMYSFGASFGLSSLPWIQVPSLFGSCLIYVTTSEKFHPLCAFPGMHTTLLVAFSVRTSRTDSSVPRHLTAPALQSYICGVPRR